MKISELFPSKYLSAPDLDGPTTVKIRDVVMEELQVRGGSPEWKPKLNLVGHKPFVLNKTNAIRIGKLYGEDTDEWAHKWVTLYPTQTPFGGEDGPGHQHQTNQVRRQKRQRAKGLNLRRKSQHGAHAHAAAHSDPDEGAAG